VTDIPSSRTVTPRIIFVCDTCRQVHWESENIKVNSAAAQPCKDAGHDVYCSGVGRLDLPTVRRYLTRPQQPVLF
jgi:hypothetical protein